MKPRITLPLLINTPTQVINETFQKAVIFQTFSAQQEELFEQAHQDLRLPEVTYEAVSEVPFMVKVYIIYIYANANKIQGERITPEAKGIVRDYLKLKS